MSKDEKKNEEVVEEKVETKEKVSKTKEKGEFDDINRSDKKFSIVKVIGNFIFWGVFIIFIGLAVIAYINYNALENDEEPSMYSSMEEYKIDEDGNKADEGENVTVYNYYIYKVVEHYNEDGRQVSLKLWFLDDVTKD